MNKETMAALLDEVKRTARYASLTGALKTGTRPLIETFNRCLTALQEQGDAEAQALFAPLAPESTMDEIGVYAGLLARYVRPENGRRHHCDDED